MKPDIRASCHLRFNGGNRSVHLLLISQNRTSADRREDLNLQITLLIEQELTKREAPLICTAGRLDLPTAADPEPKKVEKEVAPHVVSDTLAADPENR